MWSTRPVRRRGGSPVSGIACTREDPRAVAVLRLADEWGKSGDGVRLVRAIETVLQAGSKPIPVNVDGVIAGVLFDLGYPALAAKLIFIIGRTAGLAAHVIEEYTRERAMRIKGAGHLRRSRSGRRLSASAPP